MLLDVLLFEPKQNDIYYNDLLSIMTNMTSKKFWVNVTYDNDGTIYSLGVRHSLEFIYLPWEQQMEECVGALKEYLQKIQQRSVSQEEALDLNKQQLLDKKRNELEKIEEKKESELKSLEEKKKKKLKNRKENKKNEENIESNEDDEDEDEDDDMEGMHNIIQDKDKIQDNVREDDNIDIDEMDEINTDQIDIVQKSKQIRKVRSRTKSEGSASNTNINLTDTSQTPEMISKPNVESNSNNDAKEPSAESEFSSNSNNEIITDFVSANIEMGEVIDENIGGQDILLSGVYDKLSWNIIEKIGIENYIIYNGEKIQVFAKSMSQSIYICLYYLHLLEIIYVYMFLFCLLLFVIVQKEKVIKDDILGLLDKYEDWCNDSVEKLKQWVDEKNKEFDTRKEEKGTLPTTEESDFVNAAVEQISKITCIKTDMLILKSKIVEKDNQDIDDNDSLDL